MAELVRDSSDIIICRYCKRELDPKDYKDHMEIHIRAALLEDCRRKKAELEALKKKFKGKNKQVFIEKAIQKAEAEAAAEEVRRKNLEAAKARRERKLKKAKKPSIQQPETSSSRPCIGDKENDADMKELEKVNKDHEENKGAKEVEVLESKLVSEPKKTKEDENLLKEDEILPKNVKITVEDEEKPKEEEIFLEGKITAENAELIQSQLQHLEESLNLVLLTQQQILKQTDLCFSEVGTSQESEIMNTLCETAKADFEVEADWERIHNEFAKQNVLNQERHQMLATSEYNEFCAAFEKIVKNEFAVFVSEVVGLVIEIIEETIPTAVKEAFQSVWGDMAVNPVYKANLEEVVSQKIGLQFRTSGKKAIQEELRLSIESSIVPFFEISCKNLANQVESSFEATPELQVDTVSPMTLALRDSLNLVSSMAHSLTNELADGSRKIITLAYPTVSLDKKFEALVDPTEELFSLVSEERYQEAFTVAVGRHDPRILLWLCSMVDLKKVLASKPPLGQGVLLTVLQRLALFGLGCDKIQRLCWMMDVLLEIIPSEETSAVFDQVRWILNNLMTGPTHSPEELSIIRGIISLIDSVRGPHQ